jgi:hypothetical protein
MTEYSIGYLDALFYEQVNDVDVRRKLRASRGFCNWHAWQSRQIASSALGIAIIANDLITEEMARLDDLLHGAGLGRPRQPLRPRIPPRAWRAFLQGWQGKRMCPACEVVLGHERHALETILDFITNGDFAPRYEASDPLCVLHTTRAVETLGTHPGLRRLLEIQRHKYALLVGELEEFCRKHDYRFAGESWGAESDSWLRAIELLVGKPDVFGNDIYRSRLGMGVRRGWSWLQEWWRRWGLGGLLQLRAWPQSQKGANFRPPGAEINPAPTGRSQGDVSKNSGGT